MSTIPKRASRVPTVSTDLVHPDDLYPPRPHTSIRTYHTTQGQQVIERGNQRIIVHQQPPPKRHFHPLVLMGIGMVVTVLLFIGIYALWNWWTDHQLDSAYGYPRTFQMDIAVGHHDSLSHPSHFIFLNLNAHVLIIELPGGDATHARIYSGPTLVEDGGDKIPVTASFQDIGNGKLDMVVHIGDKDIVYLNDGTQFKPQQ